MVDSSIILEHTISLRVSLALNQYDISTMANTEKSKSKTPLRWINWKRARRTKPDDASSRGSFHGEIIQTLTVKNSTPQIVEISSKDTGIEKDNHFDAIGNMDSEDGFYPKRNASPLQSNPLENRVSKMENKLDKVIDTIDILAKLFIGSKSNFDTPKKVIPAFKEDIIVEEKINRSPKDEIERILKKLTEGDVGNTEEKNLSAKKVFLSPLSAKSRGMVLVTTSTTSGYYLNPRINEDTDKEKMIGEFVPQCLKDIFKPRNTITLSKVEAIVASYIFCHSLNEEIDRKEILVRTNLEYCEGQRILFNSLKPKGEIEQDVFIPMNDDNYHWYLVILDFMNKEVVYLDSFPGVVKREARLRSVHTVALYMENLLQHPNFYQYERTEKPQLSKWPIYEPEGICKQNAESNDCGAWVILWMVEMGVDEGTRLRIALDLTLNPGNILLEEIVDRALVWLERLPASGGDHVGTD
ncbi:Ulp1 protease family, C-terminal catalytic domain [Sesbania bispinosa]|nr:Ulp1 protease family, C-terminal catalytic domain [Sesbania bispinosa]